jgi:hypothetical protein
VFALTWAVLARNLRLQLHPDSRWRLVVTHAGKTLPVSSLVPEDFSEEIAFTSPISLPALSGQKPRTRSAESGAERSRGSLDHARVK